MQVDTPSSTQEEQALLRRERELIVEVAMLACEVALDQYRIAVLERCLQVDQAGRDELKRIFRENTGEDLLSERSCPKTRQ